MHRIAAIDIGQQDAVIIAAQLGEDGQIELTNYFRVPANSLNSYVDSDSNDAIDEQENEHSAEDDNDPNKDSADALTRSPIQSEPALRFSDLEQAGPIRELLALDIESSLALVSSDEVFYKALVVPFDDPKKIDQVVPLQIQDQFPLDIEDFFIDSILLGKNSGGSFDVLSSIVPSNAIASTLSSITELGSDPKRITTKASAITAFKDLFPKQLTGNFALIEISLNRASLAIFVDDSLVFLRDIPAVLDRSGELLSNGIIQELNCVLLQISEEHSCALNSVHVVASPEIRQQCKSLLKANVQSLDLGLKVVNKTAEDIPIDDISWAIGLVASELTPSKITSSKVIDFRSGKFASKHIWKNLYAALKEEFFFIGLALFFFVGWFGSVVYKSSSTLDQIESRIEQTIQTTLPGVSLPKRQEVITLENDVQELEEQLRGMGSLSSLSPLETLNELSGVIDGSIDVEIDTLNIAESRLSFRGSVSDTPTVGRLSTVLERNDKSFCLAKVDPKGKIRGTSRVRFTAEIDMCE